MERLFAFLKQKLFICGLMLVSLIMYLIGFIYECLQAHTFCASSFAEFIISIVLYITIILALHKKYYRLFAALVLVMFSYDAFVIFLNSVDELINAINDTTHPHHVLFLSWNLFQLFAAIFTLYAFVIHLLEIYSPLKNKKLFASGKIIHLVASLMCIIAFIFQMIYVIRTKQNHHELYYSIHDALSPLLLLTLSLKVESLTNA